ncbi:MAG: dihydroorotate dehydrogenase electron transfer subunit [Candidatus Zixiibacteriota bacterium]
MNAARAAQLVWTRELAPGIFQQRLRLPQIARQSRAGQFVHLLPGAGHLFRRAFSVYATDPKAGTFDVLHQVLGEGTRGLSRLEPGAPVDTLGPLGKPFPKPPRGRRPVLVGGGLGMAPLRLWAVELLGSTRAKSSAETRPVMLLGSRSTQQAVAPYGLSALGVRPVWASDDGSHGFHGHVIALLEHEIARGKINPAQSVVYGCGPERMMAALAESCARHAMPCFVSLERSMPCGFGVCMGCVIRMKDGAGYTTFRRVCRDGPVFDASEIVF